MLRRTCLSIAALTLIAMSAGGCWWAKAVTTDNASEGLPKDARLVAESSGTIGIFESEADGTVFIVNSHPARKRADVLVYSGPVLEGEVLKVDTTGSKDAQDATLDGKSLGLKLSGGGEVIYRVYFAEQAGSGLPR
jgi:hypothetical protein